MALRAATLLGGKSRQHDEDPHEPQQREERNASSAPIDCAKYVETQADQTGSAEDTVDASVNSHRQLVSLQARAACQRVVVESSPVRPWPATR
jgi:hypothetical protein